MALHLSIEVSLLPNFRVKLLHLFHVCLFDHSLRQTHGSLAQARLPGLHGFLVALLESSFLVPHASLDFLPQ